MATFVGFEQYGLLGAVVTTIGVALPSFLIILAIASLGSKALESIWTKRAFLGLKPVVIGLIVAVSIKLASHAFLPNVDFDAFVFSSVGFSLKNLIILVIVGTMSFTLKKMSPVKIILASALLGIIIHGLF
jgi:chromate transporter